MAVAENPEGLPDCPGFSKKGLEIQRLLERVFHSINYGDDNTIFDSNPLLEFLTTYSVDDADEQTSDVESVSSYDMIVEGEGKEIEEEEEKEE